MMKTAELVLTQEWDKTFPKSDKVDHSKVTFINRYGITSLSRFRDPSERARSSRRDCTHRRWQIADS